MSSSENKSRIFKNQAQSLKDRSPFIDLFYDAVSGSRKNSFTVLSYYGIKGIGKTSLCKELCSNIDNEKSIIWSSVDFQIPRNREFDGFLVSIRNVLNSKYNITFPSFDIAYAFFKQKLNPNLSLMENNSELLKGNSPLSTILGTIDNIPSKGFISTLSRIFATSGNLYNNWWERKGKQDLANIPLLDNKEIIAKLYQLWANDINDFVKNSKKKVIIFLDSYDTLVKDIKANDSYLNKELLQKWISQLDETLIVVFSEHELNWSGNNKFSCIVKSVHMERFQKSDVEKYLKNLGIDDENIVNYIMEESNGLPYILKLAVDLYKEIENKEKRPPNLSDFGNFNIQLIDKLLSVLNEYEVETLKKLSFSLGWNQHLLFSLINRFSTGYPENEIEDLYRFSFIKETEIPGFWIIDEWIADVLKSKEDSQNRKEIYNFLFDYSNNLIKSIDFKNISFIDRNSFNLAFKYARHTLEINDFLDWFLDLCNKLRKEGQFRFILPLLEELMKMLEEISNIKTKEYANKLSSIGIYFKDLGKYNEAESLFKQSMEILEDTTGKESKEVAECMVNLADVLFCRGNYSEAEPLYINSIVLLNPLSKEESTFSAHSLINVAILFARQGKYDEAISLFEKTLSIKLKTHGEGNPEVSNIYTNIANIEFDRKNYEKAETLYRKVLNWDKKYYGENHPEIRKAMINLGNILVEEKKFNEAILLYEKAKDIIEEFYGSEHPDYAMTLNNLAYIKYITENYDTSEAYYLEALNIYNSIQGIEHPDIATLYTNLGNLYTSMKKYPEAEKYLKDSLKIKSNKLGFENPETAITYKGFAELYESKGNYKLTVFYLKKYEKILLKQSQSDNQEIKLIQEKISSLKDK
jgi:Tfp pilus assembly protein PilF